MVPMQRSKKLMLGFYYLANGDAWGKRRAYLRLGLYDMQTCNEMNVLITLDMSDLRDDTLLGVSI